MKHQLDKFFAEELTLLRTPFGFKVVELKKEFKMTLPGIYRKVVDERQIGRVIVFGCNQ